MQDRLPPQNIEAEEAVIGSILINGASINDVISVIRPEDFSREKHAQIFAAMLDMNNRSEPLNPVTVAHELEARGQLEDAGGRAFLSQAAATVPTTVHVKRYAELVKHNSVMRQLIRSANEIAELGYSSSADMKTTLNQAEDIIFKIRSQQDTTEFEHVKKELEPYYDLSETSEDAGDRISTGFPALDELLSGGLHRSDMVVLAARPSVGKSALALHIALNVALERRKVAIFSLEMSSQQVAMRLMANTSQVPMGFLRSKKVSNQQQATLLSAIDTVAACEIFVDDTPLQSVAEMRAKAHRLQIEQDGIDFIVIDYMQLSEGRAGGWQGNRTQEVSEISRHIKGMARDLKVPVLALSQLSRAIENRDSRHPQLSDLRESGSIEQDADVVIFIHRDDKNMPEPIWNQKFPDKPYPRGLAELIVAKQRHGRTGSIEIAVRDEIGSFFKDRVKQEGG